MKKWFLLFFIAATISSCGTSTEIVKSWKEPGASVSLVQVKKILVVALVRSEASRRTIEDQLVMRLQKKAFPSYVMMPANLSGEEESSITAKIKDDGFDYVLMMRLADVEKEASYVPGSNAMPYYYRGYGGYYRYAAPYYYDPGYYKEDKNYFIETTVYSVPDNKLLWVGTSKTVNPSRIDKTVNEVADAVAKKMKEEGFLK
ncbi:MAG: hypothetical protein QM768_16905 [Agriterribacter sp.]